MCVYIGVGVCVWVCVHVCVPGCVHSAKKKKDVGNQKHDGSTRHYNVC